MAGQPCYFRTKSQYRKRIQSGRPCLVDCKTCIQQCNPAAACFGLQFSNPVDPSVAYGADGSPKGVEGKAAKFYGTKRDPLVGDIPGGVNVFGGGLALYKNGKVIGAVGVSGDSSCADHNIAWRVREAVGLNDGNPGGVGPNGLDGIFYLTEGEDPNGFKHPGCGLTGLDIAREIGAGGDGTEGGGSE